MSEPARTISEPSRADIVLRTNATPRDIDVGALQARLEQAGAYLGTDLAPRPR
jgi:hypothetical protein